MSDNSFTIRHASLNDVDALVAFQQSMALESEGKSLDPALLDAGVRAVFESPERGFYLVAEADGAPVGSLLITYEWSDWRNATFWWIQSVYVDAGRRRRGVYRAMHDHVFAMARDRDDICGVRLYVERGNDTAQRTYAALGMTRSHYDLFETDFVLG